jgi:hypothetical protein
MATITWLTGTSGDWSQGSDWAGGIAPGAGDDAVIDASGTYTITISTAVSAKSLTLDNSGATVAETATGSLALTGALTVEAGTFEVNAGTTAAGSLTQSGGELTGTGTVTMSGTLYATRWRLDPDRRQHHQLDQRLRLLWLQPVRHQHRRDKYLYQCRRRHLRRPEHCQLLHRPILGHRHLRQCRAV